MVPHAARWRTHQQSNVWDLQPGFSQGGTLEAGNIDSPELTLCANRNTLARSVPQVTLGTYESDL